MTVGVGHRALADAAVAPHLLAGRELQAGQDRVVEAVEIAVDQHDAAVMVLHVPA